MYNEIVKYYDQIFKFNPKVIEFIEGYISKVPSRILDIGCGTGKYVAALTERHQVVGIDPDEASINLAQKKFPGVEFQAIDLFAFKNDKKFDLIFCIGNVFSHIPKEQQQQFVDRVKSMLVDGGIWLFHTMNWDAILEKGSPNFPLIERDEIRFEREYKKLSPSSVDFITRLTIPSGEIFEDSVKLYPQSQAELELMHRGFEKVALYANYAKAAVGGGINSRVFVFKKG